MQEGYYVIRTITAGRVGEKVKFWVPGKKPPKNPKKLKQGANKKTQNLHSAVRHLARILNANYEGGDGVLALTYDDPHLAELICRTGADPSTDEGKLRLWKAVRHDAENFRRRMMRAVKDPEQLCKLVIITSDMDGETKEPVRVHIHVVCPKSMIETVKQKWKAGKVRVRRMSREPDHIELAKYLLDQVRYVEGQKKFVCTRNMILPEVKDRIAKSGQEPQPPKGAVILERNTNQWIPGRPQYLRYVLP